MEEEKEIYEIGFHVVPTVPEDKVQEMVLKLENLINENGGSIISQEFPKLITLAYEIKKRAETKCLNFNKAYFGWIKFEIPHALVGRIKEGIENDRRVLRFLIIKTVKENTMHIPRPPVMKTGSAEETKTLKSRSARPKAKDKVTEAEIDKSIDELLVNEN